MNDILMSIFIGSLEISYNVLVRILLRKENYLFKIYLLDKSNLINLNEYELDNAFQELSKLSTKTLSSICIHNGDISYERFFKNLNNIKDEIDRDIILSSFNIGRKVVLNTQINNLIDKLNTN